MSIKKPSIGGTNVELIDGKLMRVSGRGRRGAGGILRCTVNKSTMTFNQLETRKVAAMEIAGFRGAPSQRTQ